MPKVLGVRLLPVIVLILALSTVAWSLQAQDAQSTDEPESAPEVVTEAPTEAPTEVPTEVPTEQPTEVPTEIPTEPPTEIPTEIPTEVPTEIPTEVPTELPTDVPTEIPTDVPTEVPTDAPTDVQTDLPTDVATEPTDVSTEPTDVSTEPTDVATEPTEATAEPTDVTAVPSEEPLPPEPTLRLLAAETFDSGDLSQWRMGNVWSLVESDGGQALSLNAEAGLIQFRPYPILEDVAVTVRVQTGAGTAYILLRQGTDENYSMTLDADGHVILTRRGEVLKEGNLAAGSPDSWRFVRFSVVDGILRASVDSQVIAVADDDPLPAGAVSIGGTLPTDNGQVTSSLLLDDIIIEVGQDEQPPTVEPTQPTEATQPPVTETPTPLVTATPTPTEIVRTEEPTQVVVTPTPTNIEDGRVVVTPQTIIIEPTRRVQASAPVAAAPTLVLPANNAFTNDSTPLLQWGADAGTILFYQIWISPSSTFPSAGRVQINTPTNATTIDVPNPLPDGQKYWRVRARFDNATWGGWSGSRTFTVDTVAPTRPVRTGPACNSPTNFTDTTPTFSWNAVSGAFRYEVILDTITPPVHQVANIGATSYTPGAPLLYRTYYWRLRARDQAGNYSPWTTICTLPIVSATNAAPVLNRNTSAQVPLTWTPISWATAYQVQVATNTSFSQRVYNNNAIAAGTTTVTTTSLLDGTYFWRVRAKRSDGTWGGWSSTGTFTVETT